MVGAGDSGKKGPEPGAKQTGLQFGNIKSKRSWGELEHMKGVLHFSGASLEKGVPNR